MVDLLDHVLTVCFDVVDDILVFLLLWLGLVGHVDDVPSRVESRLVVMNRVKVGCKFCRRSTSLVW
jgi:uncharacterized membrane protein required for colicin V production